MSRTRKDTKRYRKQIAEETNTYWGCIGGIPSDWKRLRRRSRRRQERHAMKSGKDIPVFKKCDEWDWW